MENTMLKRMDSVILGTLKVITDHEFHHPDHLNIGQCLCPFRSNRIIALGSIEDH